MDAGGAPLAWSGAAWPLPLASEALPDRRAAAAWTQRGPAAWAPVAETPPAVDGQVSVAPVDAAGWATLVGDPALVAFTLVTHEGGTLEDADVLLNTDRFVLVDPPAPRAFSRQTVVAHELGHALGLGHPCGDAGLPPCEGALGEALMAPRLAPGDHREPTGDDVAGLSVYSTWSGPGRHPEAAAAWIDDATWRVVLGAQSAGDLLVEHRAEGATTRRAASGAALELGAGIQTLEIWTPEGQGLVVDRPDAGAPALAAEPAADTSGGGGCATAEGDAASGLAWLLLAGLRRRAPIEHRTMTDAGDRRGEDDST